MGARRRCCCGCVTFTDDFDRADNADDLGSEWEIVNGSDGDWQISSNRAKANTADVPAVYIPHLPDREGSMVVTVDLVDCQYGDVYDVILAYHDEDNFLFARFKAPPSAAFPDEWWTQGVGSRVAGVETIYWDDVELTTGCGIYQERFNGVNAARTVTIHFDRLQLEIGGATPGYGHYALSQCYSSPPINAWRAGLRHGGGPRPIYFDNFHISEHARTNPTCPIYGCRCKKWHCFLPDSFVLSLALYSGTIPCEEIPETLDVNLTKVYRSQNVWRSDRLIGCLGSVNELSYRQWFLECLGAPGTTDFRLIVVHQLYDTVPNICVPDLDQIELYGAFHVTWTALAQYCDPFSLTYEETTGGWLQECCWEEYFEPPDPPLVYRAVITLPE